MLAQLTFVSWETIARRSLMIAQGTCNAAEYRRMIFEKAAAARRSTVVAMRRSRNPAALMLPWHTTAVANARRLRRK